MLPVSWVVSTPSRPRFPSQLDRADAPPNQAAENTKEQIPRRLNFTPRTQKRRSPGAPVRAARVKQKYLARDHKNKALDAALKASYYSNFFPPASH